MEAAITRAQIASYPSLPVVFTVSGYSVPGDLGAGAQYTSQGATSGGPLAIQNALGVWYQLVLSTGLVNAGWWGATGNGVTNDTTALQTWITFLQTNHTFGFLPAGNFLISSTLNFSETWGWGITGAGRRITTITQNTNNIAIFNLGSDTASSMHSIHIRELSFNYTNLQSSANTSANCILLTQMAYESDFRDLDFMGGYYGMYVPVGSTAPWGCSFDDLVFDGNLSGGCISFVNSGSGIPNNHFGRMFVTGTDMVGPAFNMHGYNMVIDAIECVGMNQGAALFNMNAGGECTVGAIKIENGTYGSTQSLITIPNAAHVHFGQVFLGGDALNITGGNLTILNIGGGGPGAWVAIDSLTITPTSIAGGSNVYCVQSGAGSWCEVGVATLAGGAQFLNQGSTTTGEVTIVRSMLNNQMSQNLGDANYTVLTGGPNILSFQTAFSAQRTITIPAGIVAASTNNDLFNGLYYEFIFNGAINGANTAIIKSADGPTTLLTVTSDKVIVRFTYRRNPSYAFSGWTITKYENIGAGVQHVYSTNSSTSASTLLVAADIFSGSEEHTLNLTGAISSASNAQLPTVANLATAFGYTTLGSPPLGSTYKLRIINGGGTGSGIWTLTTNTGWTLTGSTVVPIGSYAEFYVTLNSLTTATIQAISPALVKYGLGYQIITGTSNAIPTSSIFIGANAVGGVVAAQLPAATGSGNVVAFKKVDTTSSSCTLTPNGSDKIDGAANWVTTVPYSSVSIIDAGVGIWYTVA